MSWRAPHEAGILGPRIGLRYVLMSLIGGLMFCWPALLTGDVFFMRDTAAYLRGGRIILSMAEEKLEQLAGGSAQEETVGPSTAQIPEDGPTPQPEKHEAPNFVRSFIYSTIAYLSVSAAGPLLLSFLQGTIASAMILLLVDRRYFDRSAMLLAGAVLLAVATPLAIYTTFLVPDIFSGLIVLHATLLVIGFDRVGPGVRLISTVIACISVVAHYGNPPMAAALYLPILGYLYLRRRFGWAVVLATVLPVLMSPVANLTASTVALETPSVMPMRLPILLARSIGDGPGLWYLQEACPEADLAFCRAFGDRIPQTTGELLWGLDGLYKLTEQEMQQIREEEFPLVLRIFRAYPVETFDALFGNALRQVITVGTDQIISIERLDEDFNPVGENAEPGASLLRVYDVVLPATSIGFLLMLLLASWLRRRRDGPDRRSVEAVAVLLVGLLINAAIFGGLSAPVDRYQARIVWIVALFALLEVARLLVPPRTSQTA